MKTKYYIILAAGIFLAGFFVARYTTPTITVPQEKEVVKTQIVHDTKTVTKIVKAPDGTVTTEITKDQHTTKDSTKDKTVNNPKLYRASLFTTTNFDKYGLVVERRIAGPLFVGGWVTTEKQAGISVGIEF